MSRQGFLFHIKLDECKVETLLEFTLRKLELLSPISNKLILFHCA